MQGSMASNLHASSGATPAYHTEKASPSVQSTRASARAPISPAAVLAGTPMPIFRAHGADENQLAYPALSTSHPSTIGMFATTHLRAGTGATVLQPCSGEGSFSSCQEETDALPKST